MRKRPIEQLPSDLERLGEMMERIRKEVAVKLLKETRFSPPLPPIDTGKLASGGAAFVGGECVATTPQIPGSDPTPPTTSPSSDPSVISVGYSALKPAGPNARVYMYVEGGRYFDYAIWQHLYNIQWIDSKLPLVERIVPEATRKVMEEWMRSD